MFKLAYKLKKVAHSSGFFTPQISLITILKCPFLVSS